MTVHCLSCKHGFEGYLELAQHIATSKKGHARGKKWAAKYLLQVNRLNHKRDLPTRTPLSQEDKENRRETRREISGETELVPTRCPRCRVKTQRALEVEYVRSGQAWGDAKYLFVLCPVCARP